MPAFNKITDTLYQGSWPESFQMGIEYDIVINVADDPCYSLQTKSPHFYQQPVHYWIPVNEWSTWSYEVFYAVKKILDRNLDKKCLIHCHAGICRSQMLLYGWLFSNGETHLFPEAKESWEYFISAKFASKAPPRLEDFLLTMNVFPNYSVIGILGELMGNSRDSIEQFLNRS